MSRRLPSLATSCDLTVGWLHCSGLSPRQVGLSFFNNGFCGHNTADSYDCGFAARGEVHVGWHKWPPGQARLLVIRHRRLDERCRENSGDRDFGAAAVVAVEDVGQARERQDGVVDVEKKFSGGICRDVGNQHPVRPEAPGSRASQSSCCFLNAACAGTGVFLIAAKPDGSSCGGRQSLKRTDGKGASGWSACS